MTDAEKAVRFLINYSNINEGAQDELREEHDAAIKTINTAIKTQDKVVEVTVEKATEIFDLARYDYLANTGKNQPLVNRHTAIYIAKLYPNGLKIVDGGE